jgi:hypothetical protein
MMHLPRQTLRLLRHRSFHTLVDESTTSVLRDFVGALVCSMGAQESDSSGPDGLSLTEVAAIMVPGKAPDSTKRCSSTHSK